MGKKRRYITGLDGIRAIAVIMVLAYHLKLALFKSGFLGVTVFFVLSGYLITGILISEVEEEGTIDLKNFWPEAYQASCSGSYVNGSCYNICQRSRKQDYFYKGLQGFPGICSGI